MSVIETKIDMSSSIIQKILRIPKDNWLICLGLENAYTQWLEVRTRDRFLKLDS